jgi:hypothetical protein
VDLPTIAIVGDSHAMHLTSGLEDFYRDRANILLFSSIGCQPLLAKLQFSEMKPGANRCQALNEEVVRNLIALQPAAIVIGGYFSDFYSDYHRLEYFLKDFAANVATLRQAGVRSPIYIMGQVPTWSPDVSDLVIDDLLAGRKPPEVTRENLQSRSIETDALLAAHAWGENVHYISQVSKLCGDQGCRRFVGPRVPEDMIALDYGHYTASGSLNAAKNILAPVLDPVLNSAHPQ